MLPFFIGWKNMIQTPKRKEYLLAVLGPENAHALIVQAYRDKAEGLVTQERHYAKGRN